MQLESKMIENGAIVAAKIGTGAVENAKIAAGAVTSGKIATNAIEASHISIAAKEAVMGSKFGLFFNQIDSVDPDTSNPYDLTTAIKAILSSKRTDGNSSHVGLVTNASYNKVIVRNSATKDQIQYKTGGYTFFGRITDNSETKTGTIKFNESSKTVNGTNTLFQSELAVGDWIGSAVASGRYFQVESITSDTLMTITEIFPYSVPIPYPGNPLLKFKINVTFYYFNGSSEVEAALNYETYDNTPVDLLVPFSYDLQSVPFTAFAAGVAFSDPLPSDHVHDDRYFTETELTKETATGGANNIGMPVTNVVGATDLEAGSRRLDLIIERIARKTRYEKKTIVTEDVIPDLTYTPREAESVVLFLSGQAQRYGASYDYTVSGKAVTWSFTNSGLHIDPGDEVWMLYDSSD